MICNRNCVEQQHLCIFVYNINLFNNGGSNWTDEYIILSLTIFVSIGRDEPEKRHVFAARAEDNVVHWVIKLRECSYEYLRERLHTLQSRIYSITGKVNIFNSYSVQFYSVDFCSLKDKCIMNFCKITPEKINCRTHYYWCPEMRGPAYGRPPSRFRPRRLAR